MQISLHQLSRETSRQTSCAGQAQVHCTVEVLPDLYGLYHHMYGFGVTTTADEQQTTVLACAVSRLAYPKTSDQMVDMAARICMP